MESSNSQISIALGPGNTLCNGKYTILKKIGSGGFGITYIATQNTLNRNVCIKEYFLTGRCVRDNERRTIVPLENGIEIYEKYRQAFVKEGQTLAGLHHPGIVEVVDVFDENGTSYMVMNYIEGRSLQKIVEDEGPLPYEVAVNYIAQVSEAVGYIHERHILHRDIKPENIMITGDFRAVLIDFGSAREFVNDKTQAQTSILTHGYAPTEQYSTTSRKGSYTDIYALGATLYFILTGKTPMDAASRMTDEMPEPKQINPAIPEEANRTIMKAMQMKSADRHQSVQEFMNDLRNLNDVPVNNSATNNRDSAAGVQTNSKTSVMDANGDNGEKKKNHKALWIVLGVIGGLLLTAAILFFALRDNDDDSSRRRKKKHRIVEDSTDYYNYYQEEQSAADYPYYGDSVAYEQYAEAADEHVEAYSYWQTCFRCNGSGICQSCDGNGYYYISSDYTTVCGECNGTASCPICQGMGGYEAYY
ncbi:MAG: protein kinase [Bacteroidales bacterium]|nr:protein kinase [Bacteroidales bacterium]